MKKTAKQAVRKPAPRKVSARKVSKVSPRPAGKYAAFRRKLVEMRADLLKVSRREELHESAAGGTGDDMDQANQSIEKELLFELADNERVTLDQVEAALRKIDKGLYGICESCRKPIPAARLDAIPFARYCVACQSLSERAAEPVETASDFSGLEEEPAAPEA